MEKVNKMNREWHEQHRMPKNASMDQRIAWHPEHQKHCKCREIPAKLQEEIARRKGKA